MENDQIARFIAGAHWERFAGLRYAYAAYRRPDGIHNLTCRVVVEPECVEQSWLFEADVDGLLIRRGWLTIEQATRALGALRNDQCKWDENDILLRKVENGAGYRWRGPDRYSLRAYEWIGWTAIELGGSGDDIGRVVGYDRYDQLSRRLPAVEPRPFTRWSELARFLGPGNDLAQNTSANIQLFIPIAARIETVQMDVVSGKMIVEIKAPGLDREAMSLVLAPSSPSVEPIRILGTAWTAIPNRPGMWQVERTLSPGVGRIHAQLVADGELVDERQMLGSPSLPIRAHAAIDHDSKWLAQRLGFGSKTKSDGFEIGVTALLSLCGIPTVHYGFDSHDNFPDLVGCAGSDLLLVGECTIDVPGRDKVRRIGARAEALRERVSAGQNWSVSVAAALFTPLPEGEVASETQEEAATCKVAVVGHDRLYELSEALMRGESPEAIWSLLRTWGGPFLMLRPGGAVLGSL